MSNFTDQKEFLRPFYEDYQIIMPYYAVLDIINCFEEEVHDLEVIGLLLSRAYCLYVMLEKEIEGHKIFIANFTGDYTKSKSFKRYLNSTIEELEVYEKDICRILDMVDNLKNS